MISINLCLFLLSVFSLGLAVPPAALHSRSVPVTKGSNAKKPLIGASRAAIPRRSPHVFVSAHGGKSGGELQPKPEWPSNDNKRRKEQNRKLNIAPYTPNARKYAEWIKQNPILRDIGSFGAMIMHEHDYLNDYFVPIKSFVIGLGDDKNYMVQVTEFMLNQYLISIEPKTDSPPVSGDDYWKGYEKGQKLPLRVYDGEVVPRLKQLLDSYIWTRREKFSIIKSKVKQMRMAEGSTVTIIGKEYFGSDNTLRMLISMFAVELGMKLRPEAIFPFILTKKQEIGPKYMFSMPQFPEKTISRFPGYLNYLVLDHEKFADAFVDFEIINSWSDFSSKPELEIEFQELKRVKEIKFYENLFDPENASQLDELSAVQILSMDWIGETKKDNVKLLEYYRPS